MRSLVTGVDGFIGSWLAETLVDAGDDVFGLSRSRKDASAGVTRFQGDVTSTTIWRDLIVATQPDRIFHLAALNNIKSSFEDPELTMQTNVVGSLRLLDAVRELAPSASMVSVGSSAEYGSTAAAASVLTEELPLLPTSPYGISKVSQGLVCRVYAAVHKVRVVHVRPFAIIGPRKTRDALSDFCRNVVAIERGETERFAIGHLGSVRDFVDVRDGAAALVLLSEKGVAGQVYNLCNGTPATLETVLAILQGLSARPFEPVHDPARLRPADDVRIVGDGSRLRALGYAPRFTLEDTVRATLEYWRRATPA
jgi:GDP-4-dehydro-6-deoxy-D-mannose reductase